MCNDCLKLIAELEADIALRNERKDVADVYIMVRQTIFKFKKKIRK